ncbi:MAG: TldD/PmbA family protein [Acidobacteria bacterium]|nr:TldD/PmbA family protein [Acidobacteriota bacterium]
MTRRDFLAASAAVSASALLAAERSDRDKLAELALSAAKKGGADYADVRISRYDNQGVFTRERQVQNIVSSSSYGYGVRVLKNGAWGFSASNDFRDETVKRIVAQAIEIAEANAKIQSRPVRLAPLKAYTAKWKSAYEIDPFTIPVERKADLLIEANEAALGVKGVSFVSSALQAVREDRYFASSLGSRIEQDIVRSNGGFSVTAVDRAKGDAQSRDSLMSPVQRGWEAIEEYPFVEEARQAGEEAVEKLKAPSVEPGAYDLLLHPTHLWLTIHESCGHPTELDRALGYEANYAGTSFLTPDKLGKFRYGSKWVNMVADRTQPHGLATVAYDDDGAPAERWPLIQEGVFVDYQTTREQAGLVEGVGPHACSHADSWSSVVFQRMPNVSLDPMDSKLTEDELMADIKNGILILGRGSFSIDQQRYNFQFGGQLFWEIKNGKKTRMLRDVAYQSRTPEFWNACDGVASRKEYLLGGSFNDGKGEPPQSNAVSHGCSPTRFRGINVINTGRQA